MKRNFFVGLKKKMSERSLFSLFGPNDWFKDGFKIESNE